MREAPKGGKNDIRNQAHQRQIPDFILCKLIGTQSHHEKNQLTTDKFYDYFIVNDGIDKRTTMLRTGARSRSSTQTRKVAPAASESSEGEDKPSDEAVTEAGVAALTSSMSAMKVVPRTVKFGRGGRAGFSRS